MRPLWACLAALSLLFATAACAREPALTLQGRAVQGGLMIGRIDAPARITVDGRALRQTPDGTFVLGFGRDHGAESVLRAETDTGVVERRIAVEARAYEIQRIDGLPPDKVTPPPEVLARIARENELIKTVRATDSDREDFRRPFAWPVAGRISGVYGSQRILNGEPRQPHYGIDIAAPEGTPVHEAVGGVVLLAEPDFYYTGGTVAVDHGHGIVGIYSHLLSIAVAVGDRVEQGGLVGTVGATGRATGPHLDWRVSWFGERLDPALLLPPPPQAP